MWWSELQEQSGLCMYLCQPKFDLKGTELTLWSCHVETTVFFSLVLLDYKLCIILCAGRCLGRYRIWDFYKEDAVVGVAVLSRTCMSPKLDLKGART